MLIPLQEKLDGFLQIGGKRICPYINFGSQPELVDEQNFGIFIIKHPY